MAFEDAPYFYPIIYVRGYAMTQSEIDGTTADPFCGFNLGATVYRATPDQNKPAKKFVFESPVLRLASDFGYTNVYKHGMDIVDATWTDCIPRKSIIIYRYYDPASTLLGNGQTPKIEEFAQGLDALIRRVRDLVCGDTNNNMSLDKFRCYLVAHSMGGLVCRAFLQNPALGSDEARNCVDKVFTYATPHNGIEMGGINVPSWLSKNDINNFNRDYMAQYLNINNINASLYERTKRVDWVPDSLARKCFCLIGTNRSDYEVAQGLSRTFAGHGSDGLVRIENAFIHGVNTQGDASEPCAKAFAYRSHSGFFGIVNSEESYQNLVRFLFGILRVDIWVDIQGISLPQKVQEAQTAGKTIDALYQLEILASPRGKPWYLTRRIAEEDSVACLSHSEWVDSQNHTKPTNIYLSSVFLDYRWKDPKSPDKDSLAYSVTLGARVPDYEINQQFWLDQHYEGCYLFRDTVIIEVMTPQNVGAAWKVKYSWQNRPPAEAREVSLSPDPNGNVQLKIPFESTTMPGMRGQLRFAISKWNA